VSELMQEHAHKQDKNEQHPNHGPGNGVALHPVAQNNETDQEEKLGDETTLHTS